MLFLRSWLEDYINLSNYTNQELSDLLSLKSGECEEVNTITDYYGGKVVVGKIMNLYKHPEADKLNVFDVYLNTDGSSKVQIVSAAPNARDGLIIPVALDGAKLPYMTIAAKKMRGLESQGMCCGMSELALETEFSSGLWELNELLEKSPYQGVAQGDGGTNCLGQSICTALPQYFPTQTTFEIKYLQDRLSQCANHLGLAMEIAVCAQKPELLIGDARMVYFGESFATDTLNKIQPSETQIKLIDKTETVDTYTILDVELPKPYILDYVFQTRMFLTGKNLVGGIVDLSNYLLYDMGQPNHFFSNPKITDHRWIFDKLKTETKFQGLGQFKNGTLPKDLVVMSDSKGEILIVPGITGSESTKSENSDTKFLLEVANFDKEMVARNCFAMNYRSDSAKFFASGVNRPLILLFFYKILKALPQAKIDYSLLWHGEIAFENTEDFLVVALEGNHLMDDSLMIDLDYIAYRLDNRGLEYWQPILLDKLQLLGKVDNVTFEKMVSDYAEINIVDESEAAQAIRQKFPVAKGMTFEQMFEDFRIITSNGFYGTLETNEDVLFELTKLIGFENLEREFLSFDKESAFQSHYDQVNNLKDLFVDFGFSEVYSRPFVAEQDLLSSLQNKENIALKALSSQREDQPWLRDSILSSLFKIVTKNIKLGYKDPQVFEVNKIYTFSNPDNNIFATPIENKNNKSTQKTFETNVLEALSTTGDVYTITTLINSLGPKLGNEATITESQNPLGQGYEYSFGDVMKVELLEICNKIKKQYDAPITKKIWWIRIQYNPKLLKLQTSKKYFEQSDFSTVKRSISLVIPSSFEYQKVQNLDIEKLDFEVRMQPVERFELEAKAGFNVLNIDFKFVNYEKTLTSEEVESYLSKFVLELQKIDSGVELR
jgi:phenylalanyl-tRNA synthetase beta subunit/tRNA-binding EMAP/Myf-like protein